MQSPNCTRNCSPDTCLCCPASSHASALEEHALFSRSLLNLSARLSSFGPVVSAAPEPAVLSAEEEYVMVRR